jgi:hypothetical protein
MLAKLSDEIHQRKWQPENGGDEENRRREKAKTPAYGVSRWRRGSAEKAKISAIKRALERSRNCGAAALGGAAGMAAQKIAENHVANEK